MSHAIQPDLVASELEPEPEPGANYTLAYREFFERLRRARIAKGLSLFEVAELVGLQLPLAYEFENLIAPLPFEWLEVWCKVIGVPFADYLVVYWASEEAYFQKLEREREAQAAQERGDTPDAPAPTAIETPETTIDATETNAPASESASRNVSILAPLRAAFARVAIFFSALFSTPRETPE